MTTAPARTPSRVQLRIIGPMTLIAAGKELDGRALGAVKLRMLLELLVRDRGRSLSKDELVDALWSNSGGMPADPKRALEHYVSVLRSTITDDKELGRAVLPARTGSYLLDPDHLDVDEDRFTTLIRHAAHGTAADRRPVLEAAVSLGDGELYADSPKPEWSTTHRSKHRETVSWAHQVLAGDALRDNDLHRAVWHGEQALRFTPCAEHPYHLLMMAHVGLGDRDLARVMHRRCEMTLRHELGLAPTARTLALAEALDGGATAAELAGLLVPVATD